MIEPQRVGYGVEELKHFENENEKCGPHIGREIKEMTKFVGLLF